jgi:hypothetical protein
MLKLTLKSHANLCARLGQHYICDEELQAGLQARRLRQCLQVVICQGEPGTRPHQVMKREINRIVEPRRVKGDLHEGWVVGEHEVSQPDQELCKLAQQHDHRSVVHACAHIRRSLRQRPNMQEHTAARLGWTLVRTFQTLGVHFPGKFFVMHQLIAQLDKHNAHQQGPRSTWGRAQCLIFAQSRPKIS